MCASSSTVTDSRRAAPPDSSAIMARSRATATKTLLGSCICTVLPWAGNDSERLVGQMIHRSYLRSSGPSSKKLTLGEACALYFAHLCLSLGCRHVHFTFTRLLT